MTREATPIPLPHDILAPVDVPCGDCRRCCTDWQVVGVTAQELLRFDFEVELGGKPEPRVLIAKTRKGDRMAVFTVEDAHGGVEVIA